MLVKWTERAALCRDSEFPDKEQGWLRLKVNKHLYLGTYIFFPVYLKADLQKHLKYYCHQSEFSG